MCRITPPIGTIHRTPLTGHQLLLLFDQARRRAPVPVGVRLTGRAGPGVILEGSPHQRVGQAGERSDHVVRLGGQLRLLTSLQRPASPALLVGNGWNSGARHCIGVEADTPSAVQVREQGLHDRGVSRSSSWASRPELLSRGRFQT
ncbi:MAG TPA: hypothetical protein VGR26_04625 [Acidimicrobiales bacterium]|nr:hypothetical protein [Acidimicrobiales bacterium]